MQKFCIVLAEAKENCKRRSSNVISCGTGWIQKSCEEYGRLCQIQNRFHLLQSEITDITISSDGKVKIEFILNPSVSGEVKVTEVQLYSTSRELWWSKAENITKKSKKEGIYYRVTINILEE